jgi:isopenicillin-N N-acyltransferase like protein
MPALCGVNSDGLAVWCNALYGLAGCPDGVPVSCIVRHLISCRTLEEARSFVEEVPHASGQHYLLAGPDGIVSLECSGNSVVETPGRAGAVWHANHPVASPDGAGSTADGNSLARDRFMAETVSKAGSPDDVCRMLEDRTVPVCKTGDARGDGYTLWAAVVEHWLPPGILVSPGPPERGSWEHVQL